MRHAVDLDGHSTSPEYFYASGATNSNVIVFANALKNHEFARTIILPVDVVSGLRQNFATLTGFKHVRCTRRLVSTTIGPSRQTKLSVISE